MLARQDYFLPAVVVGAESGGSSATPVRLGLECSGLEVEL